MHTVSRSIMVELYLHPFSYLEREREMLNQ
jgi:hypothetical protein